jgi:hypothetical protein
MPRFFFQTFFLLAANCFLMVIFNRSDYQPLNPFMEDDMIPGKVLFLLSAAVLLVFTASSAFAAERVVVASPKAPKAIAHL